MDVRSVQEPRTLQFRSEATNGARREDAESERRNVLLAKQSDPTLASMQVGSITPDRGTRVNQVA